MSDNNKNIDTNAPHVDDSDFIVVPSRGVPIGIVIVLVILTAIVAGCATVMYTMQQYQGALAEREQQLKDIGQIIRNDNIDADTRVDMIDTILGGEYNTDTGLAEELETE